MSKALRDIESERQRQVHVEDWSPEHDDEHIVGELSRAAACYALEGTTQDSAVMRYWPWSPNWWKPSDRRRNLVKAGALIVAEIERLDRAASKQIA